MQNKDQVNIDKIIEYGNFWFLRQNEAELYAYLVNAESKVRLDFGVFGTQCRLALELFINCVITDYGFRIHPRKFGEDISLSDKINNLRNEVTLSIIGYLTSGEKLNDKPILPRLEDIRYRRLDGRESKIDPIDFIRRVGNMGVHTKREEWFPDNSFENKMKVLKGFHQLLKKYYTGRIGCEITEFESKYMPVGQYRIYDSYVPNDSNRSRCNREFLGYQKNRDGKIEFYAILRLYNRSEVEEKFIKRNRDAYVEASRYSFSSVPIGMIRLDEITDSQLENHPFYVIAYEFNAKPTQLNNQLLGSLDILMRIRLCKRIVDCFYNLHNLAKPIYIRLFSHENIFICDINHEFIPYVIKFDYARIESADSARTVVENAIKAKGKLQELNLLKYLAPEWESGSDLKTINWAKVDLYALGILLCDILSGRINTKAVSLHQLESLDISSDLLDALDSLRAEMPSSRIDIEEIQMFLREEEKKWNINSHKQANIE